MLELPTAAAGLSRGAAPVALPSRHVIEGDLLAPVVASGSRWRGVAVELFRASHVDALVQPTHHVIGVQLRACHSLTQSRDGRSQSRPVRCGDVMITPAGGPKRWRSSGPREWITVRLDPAVFDGVAAQCVRGGAPVHLLDNFGTRDPAIEGIARRLVDEAQSFDLASDVYVDAVASELAVHLLRRYSTASVHDERAQPLPEHKLRRAREYVDANLAEPLSVRNIADAIAMSAHHFAHVFARTTGQTPHRFVVERRVERAKWLLRHSEAPLIDIAHEVGCRSQAHFAVLFRRETGRTPSDYRRDRR